MSTLSNLLRQVEQKDPQLAADLVNEVKALGERRAFGLNFERHTPETVELPGRPVRKGDKVRRRPERGSTAGKGDKRLWRVSQIQRTDTRRVAHLVRRESRDAKPEVATCAVDDLVVVAEFRDPIYPGLKSTGKVARGSDTPFHAVINAENFHALQALLYTHEGKVDVIYIDPPYNTGGKSSWLYNDDYVDSDDAYTHSKWLAFMERRLTLAKRLLSESGVIFISIDDAEQHRLRMLLDQVFGEHNFVDTLAVEMSTTSGPKTVNAQQGTIVKNVEFVHIYKKSAAFDRIKHTPLFDAVEGWDANYSLWLNEDGSIGTLLQAMLDDEAVGSELKRFDLLDDRGRFDFATKMHPLLQLSPVVNDFIHSNLSRIARTDRLPVSCADSDPPVGGYIEYQTPERTYLLTRLTNGNRWQVIPLARNYRAADDYKARFGRTVIRGDLWKGFHSDMAHVGNEGGVKFNNGKKPVRLIKQLIRWANNAPDSIVVDFFGGSGTTAHAVMAMNAEDGGKRQAIVITNNEVNETTRNDLRKKGLLPGDAAWEAEGVCEAVTKPRLTNCANSTTTPANLEFFTLTYEAPRSVAHHRSFEAISPLLWLKAGAQGRRIDTATEDFDVAEAYGVLFDMDCSHGFLEAVEKSETVRMAFIVTDDDRSYQMVCSDLPAHVEPVRLYESYLTNFTINTGRE